MKSKKKKHFTKAEIPKVKEFENPEFILRIAIVNYDDLKKWNLIDSKAFKRYLRKKINSDYEGGDVNE